MTPNKSVFPLTSEWIQEFKNAWFKDNGSLPKKVLYEKWREMERTFNMIHQYQRRAFEKNVLIRAAENSNP